MLGVIWAINIILLLVLLFFIFWRFVFLRDPKRNIPAGNNVVCPADGKIITVVDLEHIDELTIEKGLVGKIKTICSDIGKKVWLISIFMNPLDVHVQRAPVNGKVISTKYSKGKLLPVYDLKRGLINEKNEIIIKNKDLGKIKVIQIAGIMARRIECFVKEKQNILKGQRIGLINLGSQVTMILPKKVKLDIKMNQKVKAGETIIGKW